jgi:glycosyltransferase involved in cell wall biosynthesis
LIVVDDSVEQHVRIDPHPKISVLKTGGAKGVSIARNLGADSAKGDWIAFADDDDVWDKNKLQKQISKAKDEDLDMVLTSAYVITRVKRKRPRKVLGIYQSPFEALYGKPHLLHSKFYLPTASILIRSDFFKKFYFDEHLEERENIWLLYNVYSSGGRILQMQEALVQISYNSKKSLRRIKLETELNWFKTLLRINDDFAAHFAIESCRNFLRNGDPLNSYAILSEIRSGTFKQKIYVFFLKILCKLLN